MVVTALGASVIIMRVTQTIRCHSRNFAWHLLHSQYHDIQSFVNWAQGWSTTLPWKVNDSHRMRNNLSTMRKTPATTKWLQVTERGTSKTFFIFATHNHNNIADKKNFNTSTNFISLCIHIIDCLFLSRNYSLSIWPLKTWFICVFH